MSRHFAFEPGETVEDNNPGVVVIPNQDLGQIQFYIQTMLNDFAISLLRRFDSVAEEIGSMPQIASPRKFDETLSRDIQAKLHLRFAGRRLKLMGDLYLLAAAYHEAVTSYAGAADETKAVNDHLWNAAAQEGMQTALSLQHHKSLAHADGHVRNDLWSMLPIKLREVAVAYDRTVMPRLSFQVQLQIAELLRVLGDYGEAANALSQGWNSCRPLVVYEKLVVLSILIAQFEGLGLNRKAAFYRKRLAFLLNNLDESAAASRLLVCALGVYRDVDWTALKRSLLDQTLGLVKSDSLLTASLAFAQLTTSIEVLTTTEQDTLLAQIKDSSRKLRPGVPAELPGLLFRLSSKAPADIRLVVPARELSPSVYTPFSRQPKVERGSRLLAVVGETIRFSVLVSNPYAARLHIRSARLVHQGELECSPLDFVLEPLERDHAVSIFAAPKASGELRVAGLSYQLFGRFDLVCRVDELVFDVHPAQPQLWLSNVPDFVELLEGERRMIELQLANSKPIDATSIRVMTSSDGSAPADAESIDSLLFIPKPRPLRCVYEPELVRGASSLTLTLEATGSKGTTMLNLFIEYGQRADGSTASVTRTIGLSIPVSVTPSLRLIDLKFLPCEAGPRLDARVEAASQSSAEQLSFATRSMSNLFGTATMFSGQSYDNLLAMDGGLALDAEEWCYAVVDVVNEADLTLNTAFVEQAEATPVRIPSDGVRRIVVPLRRVRAGDPAAVLSEDQLVTARQHYDQALTGDLLRSLALRQRLFANLGMFWSTADGRRGTLSFAGVGISDRMEHVVQKAAAAVKVSVRVGDAWFDLRDLAEIPFEPVHLEVSIKGAEDDVLVLSARIPELQQGDCSEFFAIEGCSRLIPRSEPYRLRLVPFKRTQVELVCSAAAGKELSSHRLSIV